MRCGAATCREETLMKRIGRSEAVVMATISASIALLSQTVRFEPVQKDLVQRSVEADERIGVAVTGWSGGSAGRASR